MGISAVCDQDVWLLKPFHENGASMGSSRKYLKVVKVLAHVKPLTAVQIARHKIVGADISHNVWFDAQPGYDESWRLQWKDTILRPTGPAVDLHGLGEVFLGSAIAINFDNENVEIVD